MEINRVYKYRSGDDSIRNGKLISDLERDIQSIERNLLFASSIESLNDPCESLILTDKLKRETNLVSRILGDNQNKLDKFHLNFEEIVLRLKKITAVYSLSGIYNHELLWAHYANSHKGFCIEYDLNQLENGFSNEEKYFIKINYSNYPPQFKLSDMRNSNEAIQKLIGFKSKQWKYENEIRIIYSEPKMRHYFPNAIKAIYFGLRMSQENRVEFMRRLAGREIKFYEIIQIPNSYIFDRREIFNDIVPPFKYLKEIPHKITGNGIVSFIIKNIQYDWSKRKGIIETELDNPVSENALKWLAELIKGDLFSEATNVFMFHRLKIQLPNDICWATSNYTNEMINVKINEF